MSFWPRVWLWVVSRSGWGLSGFHEARPHKQAAPGGHTVGADDCGGLPRPHRSQHSRPRGCAAALSQGVWTWPNRAPHPSSEHSVFELLISRKSEAWLSGSGGSGYSDHAEIGVASARRLCPPDTRCLSMCSAEARRASASLGERCKWVLVCLWLCSPVERIS